MSVLGIFKNCYVKISDAMFDRDFARLEKWIKKDRIIFTDFFHSLKHLKNRVDKPNEHALEKSGMINHLVFDLVKRLNTIEDGATQSFLIRQAEEIAYKGASSLTPQMIALIGDYLTPVDAASIQSINRQYRNGLLSNEQLKNGIFSRRSRYIVESLQSPALGLRNNYDIVIDIVYNKIYLIIDAVALKRIIEFHHTLINNFDCIVVKQTNERERHFIQLDSENKDFRYFKYVICEMDKKIDSIQNDLSLSRKQIIKHVQLDSDQKEIEKTLKTQEHSVNEFLKENNEFVNHIKKIESLNKKIQQMHLDRQIKDKYEMQTELSFLVGYLTPFSKLKHIAFYRDSPEFEKVYSRIRALALQEMLEKGAGLKDENDKEKKQFDLLIGKLNSIALAFANNDVETGKKEFTSLNPKCQYRVCTCLMEQCIEDGYPKVIQNEWSNEYFRRNMFLGRIGATASNAQRRKAVEKLRDILIIEKRKMEFDRLIGKLNHIALAFANNDVKTGLKEFSSLKSDYQYRIFSYLRDHCLENGYFDGILKEWSREHIGRDSFLGKNGKTVSNLQRLRAVEELRDILIIEQKISEIKIASEEERCLVNGAIAFFSDDFNMGSQEYEKLSAGTKKIVNHCMKLNKFERSYVIPPGLQPSLDSLFESNGSTNFEKGHGLVRTLWNLRALTNFIQK